MDSAGQCAEKAVLSITLKTGKNWRNSRGETLQPCVLRCEFGDGNIIGESSLITADSDGNSEIDFATSITLEQEVADWNMMANTPLVLFLMESSLKESKKKRSPSFNKIGLATIDLLPILWQLGPSEQWHRFYPADRLLPEAERRLLQPPEVFVGFQADSPIIPADAIDIGHHQLAEEAQEHLSKVHAKSVTLGLLMDLYYECENSLNMLTVTLDGYYGVPDRLQDSWDCHDYLTALFLPIDQTDEVLRYDKAVCQEYGAQWGRRYWYGKTGGTSEDDFIPAQREPQDETDGSADFRGDKVNMEAMSADRPRMAINTERRFILTRKALAIFEEYASRYKVLPVELVVKKSRQAQPGAKARRKAMDDLVSVQLGMVSVDLSYLLYPGVSRLRGAYKVASLDPGKYERQTGGRRSLFMQMSGGTVEDSASTVVNGKKSQLDKTERKDAKEEKPKKAKEESRDGDRAKDKEKRSAGPAFPMPPSMLNISCLPDLPTKPEDDIFACGKMYLVLDMRLRKPLVKRHTLEQLAVRVHSLVPTRSDLPREARSAAEAQNRYHKKVKELCQTLLDELRQNEQKYVATEAGDALSPEEVWQKFAFDMNTSGKYFIIKESLKPVIIEVVREKYLKYTSFTTDDEIQDFLSQLYVYLVTEMHAALNQFLDAEEEPMVVASTIDCDTLRAFAEVAQQLGKHKKAQQFYLERMARDRQNADFWCDYGEFCVSVGNIDVAEGCFRDVLSVNPRSAKGILLLGMCSSLRHDMDQAFTCLEYAACVRRECFITQVVLGIHLERANDAIGAEIAYKSALRLLVRAIRYHQVNILLDYHDSYYMEMDCCPVPPQVSPLEKMVVAAEQEAKAAAEKAASPDPDLMLLLQEESRLEQMPDEADKRKRRMGRRQSRTPSSNRPGRGQVSEDKKEPSDAAQVPQSDLDPTDVCSADLSRSDLLWNKLYLLVAKFLLHHKAYQFAEHAVSRMLVTSGVQLSADYYITAARLHYLMGDLATANDIIQEAHKYYYRDPKLWALLGHIHYCKGDTASAQRCYHTLLDLGEQADDIYLVHMFLGEIYYRIGQYRRARSSFLLAVQSEPSPFSWLWLGKACYRLGHYGEAEEALREANLLDNICGETWAYLSLTSLLSQQPVLAEQAYKCALKLGGVSEELINEIYQVQKERGFGDPGFQSTWWSKQQQPT